MKWKLRQRSGEGWSSARGWRAKEGELLGSQGLAANGLHANGEAEENGVVHDVGAADGEGVAGKGELTEAAEEEHGDERVGVTINLYIYFFN